MFKMQFKSFCNNNVPIIAKHLLKISETECQILFCRNLDFMSSEHQLQVHYIYLSPVVQLCRDLDLTYTQILKLDLN